MDKYIKKINKYTKMVNKEKPYFEEIHVFRDEIIMKFIKDIAANKLSQDEIKLISKEINKKIINNKINKVLWYA
jgi:hypothetical protein